MQNNKNKTIKEIEVCRSFSHKKNIGNFQSVDFFQSAKSVVPLKDAEETSELLYQFCKDMVVKSLNSYTSMEWEQKEIKYKKTYENQPDLGKREDTPENKEFDKKEAMADVAMSAKKGD